MKLKQRKLRNLLKYNFLHESLPDFPHSQKWFLPTLQQISNSISTLHIIASYYCCLAHVIFFITNYKGNLGRIYY